MPFMEYVYHCYNLFEILHILRALNQAVTADLMVCGYHISGRQKNFAESER